MSNKTKGLREYSAGWLIHQLSGRMNSAMTKGLKPLGLNIRLFANLMALLIEGDLSQAELGQREGEQQYTTSRIIDALEARTLVERRTDPNSRRAHRIALTDDGKALAKKLPPIIRAVNQTVLERLDEEEQQQLIKLLQKTLGV